MAPVLTETSRIVSGEDCIARNIGGETVLLDMKNGTYFGLDETGTRIWQRVSTGTSFGEIIDALERDYSVPRERLTIDVRIFLTELIESGLAKTCDPGGGAT